MIAGNVAGHVVRQVEVVHESLFVLVLDRNGLGFIPGDCVALHTSEGKSRPYSIASGDCDGDLRFVIRKMSEGEVSPWLMNRKPGDVVGVSAPFGWFRPGQDISDSPFVFVATGTGVAPFLSCCNSSSRKAPASFLYGVRRTLSVPPVWRIGAICTRRYHKKERRSTILDDSPDYWTLYRWCRAHTIICVGLKA